MLLFESFNEIESICQKYRIRNYTINPDGTVDVDGDVNLSRKNLTKLPLKFGRVTGYFSCRYNQLTTLEGGPKYVGDFFDCYDNKLTTLEGCPEYIRGYFYCYSNKLTTLEGGPKWVGGDFYCYDNKLTTLEGGPKEVGGDFYCGWNPICQIYELFGDYKSFQDSMDYGYLRGTDIVRLRLKEALQEIGKELPESIPGYKYI